MCYLEQCNILKDTSFVLRPHGVVYCSEVKNSNVSLGDLSNQGEGFKYKISEVELGS